MKHISHSIIFTLAIIIFAFGCDDEIPLNAGEDCHQNRETLKVATNAEGIISQFDEKSPDLWCINVKGIVGSDDPAIDTRDIVIPCNLSEDLKKSGLTVIFSGELKDTRQDFEGKYSAFAVEAIYYSKLSKIEAVKTDK